MNEEHNFIEDNLIIISRQTWNAFKKQKNPVDLLGLYTFYYDCAKYQKTNQPWATVEFVCKGLGWGRHRVLKNKKILETLNLIEDIKRIDKKTGKITKWFIKIKYIWKRETLNNYIDTTVKNHSLISGTVDCPQSDFRHSGEKSNKAFNDKEKQSSTVPTIHSACNSTCGCQHTNALSFININASNDILEKNDKLESSPEGLSSNDIYGKEKREEIQSPEGTRLSPSCNLLSSNKVTKKEERGREHLTSKELEKERKLKAIKKLEEKYFIPIEERKDPECSFDYERYFTDLTDQFYEGRNKRGIIIGNYFALRKLKFMSAKAAYIEFMRNLKPATVLIEYKWDDIDSVFEYLRDSKFGKSFSWTLETVAKFVVMPEIADGSWKKREKNGEYS